MDHRAVDSSDRMVAGKAAADMVAGMVADMVAGMVVADRAAGI